MDVIGKCGVRSRTQLYHPCGCAVHEGSTHITVSHQYFCTPLHILTDIDSIAYCLKELLNLRSVEHSVDP